MHSSTSGARVSRTASPLRRSVAVAALVAGFGLIPLGHGVAYAEGTATDDAVTSDWQLAVDVPVLVNDTAPTAGATLDPSTLQLIDPATGSPAPLVVVIEAGVWSISDGGLVTFSPLPEYSGTTEPVTYTVSDTAGATIRATATVTVQPGDGPVDVDPGPGVEVSPPVATTDVAATGQGTAVQVEVLANDAPGSAGIPLDPSTVAFASLEREGESVSDDGKTLAMSGEGTYSIGPDGVVTFSPEPSFIGTTSVVRYGVFDEAGFLASGMLSVDVSPAPTPTANPTESPTSGAEPAANNEAPSGGSAAPARSDDEDRGDPESATAHYEAAQAASAAASATAAPNVDRTSTQGEVVNVDDVLPGAEQNLAYTGVAVGPLAAGSLALLTIGGAAAFAGLRRRTDAAPRA